MKFNLLSCNFRIIIILAQSIPIITIIVKNRMITVIAGDFMKDKYDGVTEVRVNKRGRLQVKNAQYNLPTANDLVYLDESPDYCLRNKTIGSFGKISKKINCNEIFNKI